MPLKTRKLGSSDLEVPIACLGTMTWGGRCAIFCTPQACSTYLQQPISRLCLLSIGAPWRRSAAPLLPSCCFRGRCFLPLFHDVAAAPRLLTCAEQNTEEEAFEQLDYALSRGLNFIDTAEM